MEFLISWVIVGFMCLTIECLFRLAVRQEPPSWTYIAITIFIWPYWVWIVLSELFESLKS